MRLQVVLGVFSLILGGLAQAGEPEVELDGMIAPPSRWSGRGGNSAGNGRSAAAPIVTEIEQAWELDLDELLAPPVLWDGVGFVVAKGPTLVAFDLRTGKLRASQKLNGFRPEAGLHISEGAVFLEIEPGKVHAYRLKGDKIESFWQFRGLRIDGKLRRFQAWAVHNYEMYANFGEDLVRVKPGTRWPVWNTGAEDTPLARSKRKHGNRPKVFPFGGPLGPPRVFGDYVIGLNYSGSETRGRLSISVRRRSDGTRVGFYASEIDSTASNAGPPRLTVTKEHIYFRLPVQIESVDGPRTDAGIRWETKTNGDVSFVEPIYLLDLVHPPAQHRLGGIAMLGERGKRELTIVERGAVRAIADETKQPDLFRDAVRPTVLGDIVYFGSWAVDLETREILWRLPVEHVQYPAVPANGMVLVVENGVLRAFRGSGAR